jgi:hypothetical protein
MWAYWTAFLFGNERIFYAQNNRTKELLVFTSSHNGDSALDLHCYLHGQCSGFYDWGECEENEMPVGWLSAEWDDNMNLRINNAISCYRQHTHEFLCPQRMDRAEEQASEGREWGLSVHNLPPPEDWVPISFEPATDDRVKAVNSALARITHEEIII